MPDSQTSLLRANYGYPGVRTAQNHRCRNCHERFKSVQYGEQIGCRLHGINFVRHSHRCDNWHATGTLL